MKVWELRRTKTNCHDSKLSTNSDADDDDGVGDLGAGIKISGPDDYRCGYTRLCMCVQKRAAKASKASVLYANRRQRDMLG